MAIAKHNNKNRLMIFSQKILIAVKGVHMYVVCMFVCVYVCLYL